MTYQLSVKVKFKRSFFNLGFKQADMNVKKSITGSQNLFWQECGKKLNEDFFCNTASQIYFINIIYITNIL